MPNSTEQVIEEILKKVTDSIDNILKQYNIEEYKKSISSYSLDEIKKGKCFKICKNCNNIYVPEKRSNIQQHFCSKKCKNIYIYKNNRTIEDEVRAHFKIQLDELAKRIYVQVYRLKKKNKIENLKEYKLILTKIRIEKRRISKVNSETRINKEIQELEKEYQRLLKSN